MNTEIWVPVAGYEKFYEVSNYGRVRSLERIVPTSSTKSGYRTVRARILKPTDNGNGYSIVGFNRNGQRKNHYVHRLVASAFLPKKEGYNTVNHKDENKRNNQAENLEWISLEDNVKYSVHLMKKPKEKSKTGKTGEKYVYVHRKHGNVRFRVMIKDKGICREFVNLQDAVNYRNEVINGG